MRANAAHLSLLDSMATAENLDGEKHFKQGGNSGTKRKEIYLKKRFHCGGYILKGKKANIT